MDEPKKVEKLDASLMDRRPEPDQVYLIVCRDGRPHTGFRQRLTKVDAEDILRGVVGAPMSALDDWGHSCGPHHIQRYVPAPHE